jgi:hypothetical protein
VRTIKFWPNKETRTVTVEIDSGRAHFEVDLDLDEADEAIDDLRAARFIVAEDWITA